MKRNRIKTLMIGLFTVDLIFILACSGIYAAEAPEIFVQTGHSESIDSVAFSPDGRYALSGSEDMSMKLWMLLQARKFGLLRGTQAG